MMSRNGKYEFKFPFEPPWEDLRVSGVASNGVKYHIFDTCVIRDPAERAAIDRRVAGILAQAERRKFLAELEKAEQVGT